MATNVRGSNKGNYGSTKYGTDRGRPDRDMEHMQSADIDRLQSSYDAKNKTQVASATSMAVIHVGILKFLLDAGPDAFPYYQSILYIVITALVLQFISGIIAIYIAAMKSFLAQFHGDFGYYWKSSVCPCLKDDRRDVAIQPIGHQAPTENAPAGPPAGPPGERGPTEEPKSSLCCVCFVPKTQASIERQNNLLFCVCCIQSPETEEERQEILTYEAELANEYYAWVKENLQQQKAEIAIAHGRNPAGSSLATGQESANGKNSDADESDVNEVDGQTLEAAEKVTYQEFIAQGVMLRKLLTNMMEDKVIKRAAFLQCILTILTYIIFALNTVITGFGLTNVAFPNGNHTTNI